MKTPWQGYQEPLSIVAHRQSLIDQKAAIENSPVQQTCKSFLGKRGRLSEKDAALADENALGAELKSVRRKITSIEQMAQNRSMESDFKDLLRKLFWLSLVVAAGAVAFAWAAYPPSKLPSADLAGVRLTGAYLRDADLQNANLDGADLTGADLTGSNLRGASINGTIWGNTRCPDGTNSDDNGDTCGGHLKP